MDVRVTAWVVLSSIVRFTHSWECSALALTWSRMRTSFRTLAALLVAAAILPGCDSPSHPRPDTTAPTVQVASPASGSAVTAATATLAGIAADSVGVARMTVQVNGGAEEAVSITPGTAVAWTAAVPLALGQNTVVVSAYDAAGNRGTATLTLTRGTAPPALIGLSIDPDSVDARTAAGSARLTFRVSDASPVTGVTATLQSESGAQLQCSAPLPPSIDAQGVGTFSCTIPIPTSTLAGAYTVMSVAVSFPSGTASYATAQLKQAGFETRLAVATTPPPGEDLPQPLALSFTPDPVMVYNSASVSFTVRATDSDGVSGMYALLYAPNGNEAGRCFVSAPAKPVDATLQCAIPFRNSPYLEPATLRVGLGLYDGQGHYRFYNPDSLAARGFDTTLQMDVDTSPPALVGFDLVPDSVDARTAYSRVKAVFTMTNGYRAPGSVTVSLANPEGNTLGCEASPPAASAPPGPLTFSCDLAVGPTTPSGTYTVTSVSVRDGTSYNTAALAAAGFDTTLKLVTATPADRTAPTVAGLSFAPDPVQVKGAQATVTFDIRLTDAGSGATGTYVFLTLNGGEAYRCYAFTRISGTPADGTYRCSITFTNSGNLQPATFGVALEPFDKLGNFAYVQPSALAAAGFDSSLELQVDTTPPALVGFSFTPDSVDVRAAGATVAFTFRVTNGYRAGGVDVTLQNEGGERLSCGSSGPASTDASGVSTFTCSIFVAPQRGAGTYTVQSVTAGQTYSTAQLQAAGYPTQLKVVSNAVTDLQAPVVAGLSLSPDPLHLSGGDQTLVLTARLTDYSGASSALFILYRPDGKEYGRCSTSTIVSGTPTDATFRCNMPVSASAAVTPTGTYLVGMSVSDVRGNVKYYRTDELTGPGLDNSLDVQP